MNKVLVGVLVFFLAVLSWVIWMDRDLVDPDRRTTDSLLLLGSAIVGMAMASMLFNILLAPALRSMKEDPKSAKPVILGAFIVFLGANGILPWAIRWIWPYRTALTIVVISFGVLLGAVLALLLVARRRMKS